MTLNRDLLHYFVRDSLRTYSEDIRILNNENPIQISLNGRPYSVHISYVHDSGNTRTNDDETRIQISRAQIDLQKARANDGINVAFIGFFEGGNVFVSWDPRHIFSLRARTVCSVYARQSQLSLVESKLAAVHSFQSRNLGETSFAIALSSMALGFYLENLVRFHKFSFEEKIQHLVADTSTTYADGGLGNLGNIELEINGEREKFSFERKAYPRDPRFKKQVLSAYGRACCICRRQLGIVQAAHIIPHSEPDCPNTIQNGLAMCIEHHRLYDDALLLPGPGQQLIFNDQKAEFLTTTGQGVGLDGVKKLSESGYVIPTDPSLQPLDDYLERGIQARTN